MLLLDRNMADKSRGRGGGREDGHQAQRGGNQGQRGRGAHQGQRGGGHDGQQQGQRGRGAQQGQRGGGGHGGPQQGQREGQQSQTGGHRGEHQEQRGRGGHHQGPSVQPATQAAQPQRQTEAAPLAPWAKPAAVPGTIAC